MSKLKMKVENDLYGMSLEYFTGDYAKNNIGSISGLTNTQSLNGNIRAMNWFSEKPASSLVSPLPTTYAYEYDAKNQLKNATWNTLNTTTNMVTSAGNAFREGDITYDANGNIKGLGRYNGSGILQNNFLPTGPPASPTYKYIYAANNNKLTAVDGYATYTHNTIGQITQVQSQATTKNMQMLYNVSGVTEEIAITGDPTLSKVRFTYDEGGKRIRKEVFNNLAQLANELFYVYDASGNLLSTYSKDIVTNAITQTEIPVYGASNLGTAYTGVGLYHYIYDLRDHLGSTRVRFSDNAGIPKVEAFYDYYPFGELITDRNSKGTDVSKREYQGNNAEKDEETGFNAFDLRMYDPIVGRWLGTDSYRQFASSYVGMGNNPVSGVDPDGGYTWFGAYFRNGWSTEGLHQHQGTAEWGYISGYTPHNYDNDAPTPGYEVEIYAPTRIYNYGKTWASPYTMWEEGAGPMKSGSISFDIKHTDEHGVIILNRTNWRENIGGGGFSSSTNSTTIEKGKKPKNGSKFQMGLFADGQLSGDFWPKNGIIKSNVTYHFTIIKVKIDTNGLFRIGIEGSTDMNDNKRIHEITYDYNIKLTPNLNPVIIF